MLEMLVTIAIISIITAVVVVRYGSFSAAVLLKSQVYELALNVREAQVFAISVRTESATPNPFRNAYGVYFTTDSPSVYTLFLDDEGNESVLYDTSPTDESLGNPFTIDSRFYISRICVNDCAVDVDNLSVSFKRPDFDAQLAVAGYGLVASAEVIVASVADPSQTKSVRINSTGQISVQ